MSETNSQESLTPQAMSYLEQIVQRQISRADDPTYEEERELRDWLRFVSLSPEQRSALEDSFVRCGLASADPDGRFLRMNELTSRQRETLGFIVEYIRSNGRAPTRREIGGHVSAVNQLLSALEGKGFIRLIRDGRARGIEVLRQAEEA
jgi:hypothetical protein